MLPRGELEIDDAINSKFENFESVLYMKSVSMPLIVSLLFHSMFPLCDQFLADIVPSDLYFMDFYPTGPTFVNAVVVNNPLKLRAG